jgi:hypothetical protein
MAQVEPLNFAQPKNKLSEIAEMERQRIFSKNDYNPKTNLYSSVNPDALANGDTQGKGTGGDLDVYNLNAVAAQDIVERKSEIKINSYQPNKPYTTPSA